MPGAESNGRLAAVFDAHQLLFAELPPPCVYTHASAGMRLRTTRTKLGLLIGGQKGERQRSASCVYEPLPAAERGPMRGKEGNVES